MWHCSCQNSSTQMITSFRMKLSSHQFSESILVAIPRRPPWSSAFDFTCCVWVAHSNLPWTTWGLSKMDHLAPPYQPKHCTCTTSHPFSWGISRQCCSSPFPFKTVKVARLMPGVRRKRTWIASRVQQRRLRGKKGSIANCSRMVDFPALSLGSRSKWNPKQ